MLDADRKWRGAMRFARGVAHRRRERESFYRYGVIPDWWKSVG
jgi:myo-inositol catabolism protein IolC